MLQQLGGGSKSGPITIGVVGPQTGPLAEIGQNQVAGAEVAAAEINKAGGVLGRKIKIVNKDEQSTPQTASTAVRDLSNSGVHLVVGMLNSAGCLAVGPTLPSLNVVLVDTGCTNDGLTGQNGKPAPFSNLFRTSTDDDDLVINLAKTIAKKFPDVTDYSAFGYNYVTGTSQWALYQSSIKKAGVPLKVKSSTFVPIAQSDFSLQVQSLVGKVGDPKTSALYLGTFGSGTGTFLKQSQSYDISKKFAVILQPGGYYPVARTLNGLAPNVWNAYDYNYAAFTSSANTKFVNDYKAKTGKLPIDWSYDAWVGVKAMAAAIKKAGTDDYSKVLATMPGLSFTTLSGKLTIDKTTHQANAPVVVSNTVGDTKSPENVKILSTTVVKTGK
ncbi:amino acid ABC substrate-binding protein [Frondihabitans sucicola]|uniref:Amino acid ABC substrate-binding protein n=1 Tax=Frondihabitans sucicola TaxID=1268041 RepID=A0ABN6XSB8_9MICO|nr:ABC transporter substrate-binding protein [Frondihabitans sucicola]BDZ47869.1 amino acid ABC substrate-binding protein [Frondihabitans sucicola]